MASNRFARARATLASRSRRLPADHPDLTALRQELGVAVVLQRIEAVLDVATIPLTPQLRAEINAVLDERAEAA